MKRLRGLRKYENGLSLIEVMAAMVIMSMIVAGTVSMQANEARDKFADHAATMSIRVQNAARTHRAETGSWPTGTAQLVAAGRLTAAEATSPFNTSYSFSVTGNNLRISANASNSTYARRLSGILPGGASSGSSYSFQFPPAGSEVSLAALYKKDGSEPLTGSMNVNNFNINNVGTVGAGTVNSTNINGTTITGTNVNGTNVNATHINATGSVNGGNFDSSGWVTGTNFSANGNVTAAGTIQGGYIRSLGNIQADGTVNVNQSIYAAQNVVAGQTVSGNNVMGNFIRSYGNSKVDGRLDVDQEIYSSNNIVSNNIMYARRYTDLDDQTYFVDANGQNRLFNVDIVNDIRLTKRFAVGAGCNSGQIGFDSSDKLIVCTNGLWTATGGTGTIEYSNSAQSSYTFGNLMIKYGKVNADDGGVRSHLFSQPFPPGFTNFSCQLTYDAYDHGGNATGCSANSTTLFTKNGNANDKDVHFVVFAMKP
ncbi:prepilin-type N-terminal cleavage/methylation domain-containing protein [Cellvibrio sp. QJXJ]|uniref:prepilin-type N-terminal cleavage/methylation domain-containing protein n=1 Tax=Cellvibrio sp. QJXJ TaxID=2964606 RepID=UPI0021C2ABA0|nr:prepilin-type N-terminal cleavage/methylation domain-containing protein [Cellvibrio sp. QJXJ]UUA75200.1 prepilin-type N-terminal cleavage/methylation domain-containing protein [Cellvibrio sp. QJXJ]